MSGGRIGVVANNNLIFHTVPNSIEIYDPELDMWSSVELEEEIGQFHSVLHLSDGRVLFVGFEEMEGSEQLSVGVAHVWDPGANSWMQVATPPLPRVAHQMILLTDGRVMVVGGVDVNSPVSGNEPQVLEQVDIFDPETNSWQQAAALDQPPTLGWLFLLSNGRVMSIGIEEDESGDYRASVRAYDPVSDTWSVIESGEPYYLPTNAIMLSDGRLLVLGQMAEGAKWSYSSDSEGNLTHVELRDGRHLYGKRIAEVFSHSKVYDPATDTWASISGMEGVRISSTLTPLPDGRVLLAGGTDPAADDHGYYKTTEVFNPESNSWSQGPILSERRSNHAATLLPDGRLLLVGGIGIWVSSTNREEAIPLYTAEIMDTALILETLPPSMPEVENVADPCELAPVPAPAAALAPAGTSQSALAVLNTAKGAMNDLDSYSFEMDLAVIDEESGYTFCNSYNIDFQAPDRFRLRLWYHYPPFGDYMDEMTIVGNHTYAYNVDLSLWVQTSWREPEDPVELIDDSFILNVNDVSIEGIETLDSVRAYRVVGKVPLGIWDDGFPLPTLFSRTEGQLDVVYWVGVDDSIIKRISVEGRLEIDEPGWVNVTLTAEFSDLSEEITIET